MSNARKLYDLVQCSYYFGNRTSYFYESTFIGVCCKRFIWLVEIAEAIVLLWIYMME